MAVHLTISAVLGAVQAGEAQPHGLGILGMALLVLVLVSLAIFLPRLRRSPAEHGPAEGLPSSADPTDEEVLAAVCAISTIFTQIDQMEHVHMTWRMYEKPYRPWRLAGRAEFLMGKQSVHNRARNRSR